MNTTLVHHTLYAGRQPTVVLIHGMTCDAGDWDSQVGHFTGLDRQVLTMDLRGHGRSMHFDGGFDMATMAGDVAALLHALDIDSAVVAGHSMGCRIATETALQAPEIVAGVALIDGSRFARGDAQAATSAMRDTIAARGWPTFAKSTFESMFVHDTRTAPERQAIERACSRPREVAVPVMLSMIEWDAARFESRYRALRVPVHVLQSSHVNEDSERVSLTPDMRIPWHDELLACGADATFERVADCGHFTMWDAPDAANGAIDALLRRQDLQPAATTT